MLIPRRVKHRKQHHPGRSGAAKGGTKIAFGDYGIQALEPAYVTNRQIESARIAMTRYMKRGGKVWINIYPDRPLTKKPAETRMGSGIYVPSRDGTATLGGGSTHAWCQVYLPGAGWVEFDPTNGIVGNRDLIRVAVARDPRQAIPLHGSYAGRASDALGMTVQVNVTTTAPDGEIEAAR